MHKKFISTLLRFILITIASYVILILVWGFFAPHKFRNNLNLPNNYGYLGDRLINARNVKDVDILFLGPSTTYRGFDPRIFENSGYKIFVFGSSAQTPKQTNLILKHYLDSLNPKLVVYDVYPAVFNSDGIEPTLDFIMHNEEINETFPLLWKNFNIKVVNAFIFKGFASLLTLNVPGDLERVMEDTYIEGGYVEKELRYNDNSSQIYSSKWNLRQDQINEFEKNINILKNHKIPYLLIRLPLTNLNYNSKENNSYVDSLFSSKGQFVNFQDKIELSDSLDFIDKTHLNQNGVKKFNRNFIKCINKNLN